jgi:type I restriction enzyme R subunit
MNPRTSSSACTWRPSSASRSRKRWDSLSEADRETAEPRGGRPAERASTTDDIESRLFDLTALRMQLALAQGDTGTFERQRQRVVEIAMLLEEKTSIPAVKQQLAYLASVQETAFWEGVGLAELEDLRLRLRGLVPFLDKKKRNRLHRLQGRGAGRARGEVVVHAPKMTGRQYEKKVEGLPAAAPGPPS